MQRSGEQPEACRSPSTRDVRSLGARGRQSNRDSVGSAAVTTDACPPWRGAADVRRQARRDAETATLSGGLFKVTQPGAITQLQLVEKLARCHGARMPKSRKLTATGSPSSRIRGADSSATGRGSKWTVQDTCAGTLTRGEATVTGLIKHKTALLKAGKTYLARPKR